MELLIKGGADLNHAYVSPPPPTHGTLMLMMVVVTEHGDFLPPYSAFMHPGEGGREGQAGSVLGWLGAEQDGARGS